MAFGPRNAPLQYMRTAVLLALLMLLFAGTLQGATDAQKSHPYRKSLKHSTLGKGAVARVAGGAALGQVHRKKYGGGAAGLGKAVGAGLATNAVSKTVEHVLAAKLHEDLHYRKSTKHGVGPRLGDALKSTIITRNTKTGKKTPAAGRIAGHAAAGAFTQAVLVAGSGASTAGIGLAADAGANVVREFVPARKHHRRHHPIKKQ